MHRFLPDRLHLPAFDSRRARSHDLSANCCQQIQLPLIALLVFVGVIAAHSQNTRALREEVSRLSTNDRTQDVRLYHLERDVDILQRKSHYLPRPPSSGSPTTSGKSGKETVNVSPASSTSKTYTVQPGDTLWRIAMNHRVSPGEIMLHNKMSNDSVKTGQKLAIPSKSVTTYTPPTLSPPQKTVAKTAPSSGNKYVVTPGDTFSQIASRHKISQAALQQANPGVNPNLIVIGSSLSIPAAAAAPPLPQAQAAVQTTAPSSQHALAGSPGRHTVRTGDTLSSIAASHGISLAALQNANKLVDPNRLNIGQVLVLPAGAAPRPDPTTKHEPTLVATQPAPKPSPPSIPTQLAPPPSTPSTATAPVMSPMPQPNPRGVLQYRVDSSDTLESIARTFTTTPDLIRELNGMSAGVKISANDEIYVPAMGAVAPER